MTQPHYPAGLPFNFAGLDPEFSSLESSRVAILPVPYDFSTSYQGGTRLGPQAILAASRNMEVWDDELGATYRAGITTLPELEPTAVGPGAQVKRVEHAPGRGTAGDSQRRHQWFTFRRVGSGPLWRDRELLRLHALLGDEQAERLRRALVHVVEARPQTLFRYV